MPPTNSPPDIPDIPGYGRLVFTANHNLANSLSPTSPSFFKSSSISFFSRTASLQRVVALAQKAWVKI
ncbi:MAG: hypothetical protein KA362_03265 [Chloroflexi bacterium]|mgnify:CR=1 FL=1|nr:hypothetical protein [Chloroflexota bacterium]MBK8933613.1 hypothetical protein [Chloroflexota bacterium]MBP6803109.1 hypothetical protein [Chloroflexota bacterium]